MQTYYAQAAQPTPADTVEIRAGTAGVVGGWRIGVVAVSKTPKGLRADLAVAGYPTDVPVEFTVQALANGLIPVADGLHRVLSIYPATVNDKGRVIITRAPIQQNASSNQTELYLARDARLRLNGPDTHGASDLQVSKWGTDQSVDVEWRPSQYAPQDTDPADIKRAHLTIGSRLDIGAVSLKVLAIDPEGVDHPQWVRFQMSTAGGRR